MPQPAKPAAGLAIGAAARHAGCSPELLRHYERIGLLQPPGRSAGGRRVYDRAALDRLSFIRQARALGFTLAEITRLARLADRPGASCAEAHVLANNLLGQVRAQRAWLAALEARLQELAACDSGTTDACQVIAALSAPAPLPGKDAFVPGAAPTVSFRRRRSAAGG